MIRGFTIATRILSLRSLAALIIIFGISFTSSAEAATRSTPKLILLDHVLSVEVMIKEGKAYIPAQEFTRLGAEVSVESPGTVSLSNASFKLTLDSMNQMANYYGKIKGHTFSAGNSPMEIYIDNSKIWVPLKAIVGYLGYDIVQLGSNPYYRLVNGKETLSKQVLMAKLGLRSSSTSKAAIGSDSKKNTKKTAAPMTSISANDPGIRKVVYLTFDDGPNGATDKILDLLKKYNMRATFFMLNNGIAKNPEMVNRMIKEGHSIGLHGVTHKANYFYKSGLSPLNEMNQANKTLEKATGFKTRLIRTPYGSRPNLTKYQYDRLMQSGYILWDWNVDSHDSSKANVDPKTIFTYTVSGMKTKDRPIVLLHDKNCTADALESILKWMASNRYVSDALDEELIEFNWWKK